MYLNGYFMFNLKDDFCFFFLLKKKYYMLISNYLKWELIHIYLFIYFYQIGNIDVFYVNIENSSKLIKNY